MTTGTFPRLHGARPRGLPSDRAREALRLRVVDGLSLAEVAERMGVVAGTVERWLAAARQERDGR
jgi:DNA-directed RNA polymerase specialized sigma24 family protein